MFIIKTSHFIYYDNWYQITIKIKNTLQQNYKKFYIKDNLMYLGRRSLQET